MTGPVLKVVDDTAELRKAAGAAVDAVIALSREAQKIECSWDVRQEILIAGRSLFTVRWSLAEEIERRIREAVWKEPPPGVSAGRPPVTSGAKAGGR